MEFYSEFDLIAVPPIRGRVSRAWRSICHGRKERRAGQNAARRRNRRAYRQALGTGDSRHLPKPYGAWDIC
jgi:hypothetical protein